MNERIVKHTPGEWTVDGSGNVETIIPGEGYKFTVASTMNMSTNRPEEDKIFRDWQEANAKLIAAAPLMLEELQELEWIWYDGDYDHKGYDRCIACGALKLKKQHKSGCTLYTAIKAATGE